MNWLFRFLWVVATKSFLGAVLINCSLSETSFAQESAASSCDSMQTAAEVLRCARRNHPDLQRGKLQMEQANRLESAAAQFPNPELGNRSVFGSDLGDQVSTVEINLTQPIELGGKRGSRIERAQAERSSVAADVLKTEEKVVLEILTTLYRLRQIRSEMGVLNEALTTYSKIQRQFRSRPRLVPEQQVSLSVFQLAEADYEIRKNSLDTESELLVRSLEWATGGKLSQDKGTSYLPARRTIWPDLSQDTLSPTGKSASRLAAEASLSLAHAELEVQRSLSWPDLKLGPSFERETTGPFITNSFGFNLTLALPLFNQNGGGRAVAARGVELAERSMSLANRQLALERNKWVFGYQRAVSTLKKTVSASEMERSHQNSESLFQRGLIPSSLVIEAHRQMVDYTKSQNETELQAMEALWNVYLLDGRLSDLEP